jgi:hypothetical protein
LRDVDEAERVNGPAAAPTTGDDDGEGQVRGCDARLSDVDGAAIRSRTTAVVLRVLLLRTLVLLFLVPDPLLWFLRTKV